MAWKYKTTRMPVLRPTKTWLETEFNVMGRQGWELVAVNNWVCIWKKRTKLRKK